MKLNYRVKAFDINNAFFLSYISELVYDDNNDHVTAICKDLGYKVEFFNKDESEAILVHNDKAIIVAFRGTESFDDVVTDANIAKDDYSWGKVHRGFLTALNKIANDIEKSVYTKQSHKKSIFITGHSLGGALATLFTARMLQKYRIPDACYTFGSPRVGDEYFANAYNTFYKSHTFRIVNNNDVVTRIPTRSMGYSHCGTFVYIDSDKSIHHNNINKWELFLDRISGRFEDFMLIGDGLRDHKISNYVASLTESNEEEMSIFAKFLNFFAF